MNDDFSELKNSEKQGGLRSNSNWIVGITIIIVGGVLLLSNLIGFEFNNWWVLFMFIPLGGIVMKVWQDWRRNGRVSTGAVIGGLAILTTITVFLFNLNWGSIWPVYFIIGGIAILLGSRQQ